MEKDLVDIITEKQFIELSQKERKELADFCSNEDEFNQMKEVFVGLKTIQFEQPKPADKVKSSLDDLFNDTYPKAAPVWYMSALAVIVPKDKPFVRQPLLKVAALALLVFLAVPFFNQNIVQEDVQLAQLDELNNEVNTDSKGIVEDVVTDEVVLSDSEASEDTELEIIDEPIIESSVFDPSPVASTRSVATSDVISQPLSTSTTLTGGTAPGSNHPDGIFIGDVAEASHSVSVADEPDVLDLLTATF